MDRNETKGSWLFLQKGFAAFFALVCLSSAAWCQEESNGDYAQVVQVEGEAWTLFSGDTEWVPAESNILLESGDRIRSADEGRVGVLTPDGDVLEIQEGSELEIGATRPRESWFRLLVGGLLAKVSPSRDKKFLIKTPIAVASVRGTEFAVDVDEAGVTEVGVTEGTVAFQGVDDLSQTQGEEQIVVQSEGASVRPGEAVMYHRITPERAARRLARMAIVRDRTPVLRKMWKQLPAARRRELRQEMRERWMTKTPQERQEFRRKIREKIQQKPVPTRRPVEKSGAPPRPRRARPQKF